VIKFIYAIRFLLQMKKGLIFAIVIILFFAFQIGKVNAASACKSAEFGETTSLDHFVLPCSSTSDGLCPEDYGDWGPCQINQNTNGKCDVPDPDCGQVIPDIMFVDFPLTAEPSAAMTINVQVNKCVFPNTLVLVRNYGDNANNPNYAVVDAKQITGAGKVTFSNSPELIAPDSGGVSYQFLTYCADATQYSINANGVTTPQVTITSKCDFTGASNPVQASAKSNLGIKQIDYALEIETSPGVYTTVSPTTPFSLGSSCSRCDGADCNVFKTSLFIIGSNNVNDNAVFDSTPCKNKNAKIIATAVDWQGNKGSKSVTCLINNLVEGCPGCTFASKLLNLFTATVKVWL